MKKKKRLYTQFLYLSHLKTYTKNAASKIQQIIHSEKARKAFDDWYTILPKWSEEEAQREAQDHLNENYIKK